MESLAQIFGRRVKELRKARKLTQEMLGQAAGIDYKFLGEIERGVKTSSFSTIEKIAQALDVEVYELFIPTARKTLSVEKEINELISNSRRIDLTKIDEFLRGLRGLLRKLDKSERTR